MSLLNYKNDLINKDFDYLSNLINIFYYYLIVKLSVTYNSLFCNSLFNTLSRNNNNLYGD